MKIGDGKIPKKKMPRTGSAHVIFVLLVLLVLLPVLVIWFIILTEYIIVITIFIIWLILNFVFEKYTNKKVLEFVKELIK